MNLVALSTPGMSALIPAVQDIWSCIGNRQTGQGRGSNTRERTGTRCTIYAMTSWAMRRSCTRYLQPLYASPGLCNRRGSLCGWQQRQQQLQCGFPAQGITTTTSADSPASRGNREESAAAAAWHLSGAFTRFDRRFEVFEISKAGSLRRTNVTLGDVLKDFGVHARDVLSLGLQDERYHPQPAVLPREGVVVVALGPFKALLHTEACLLFEAGKIDVSHVVPVLAELMQANAEVPASLADQGSLEIGHSEGPHAAVESASDAEGGDRNIDDDSNGGNGGGGQSERRKKKKQTATTPSADGVEASKAEVVGDVCDLGQEGILNPRVNDDQENDGAGAGAGKARVASPPPKPVSRPRGDRDTGKDDGVGQIVEGASAAADGAEAAADGAKAAARGARAAADGAKAAVKVSASASSSAPISEPAPEPISASEAHERKRLQREKGDESRSDIASRIGEYVGAFRFGGRRGDGEEEDAEDNEEEGFNVKETHEHQMKVMFKEQRPMPFELAMLEAMLQEVCTSYHRRAHVIRRLMEQGLKTDDSDPLFTPNKIEHYRVVPLKLALNQLELKLSQTTSCLEELMHSDEDMLGLLLTEKKELGLGQILDHHRHSVVELLLENYHRQMVLVGHDVATMKQEVESMQELAAISLDVSRNTMIAVDVRLAMLNVGVASSACVFGAIGMNVVNGMEESHAAFFALVGGSVAMSFTMLRGVMMHLRSVARAGDSKRGALEALNSICDHVDDIESVLRTELEADRDDDEQIGAGKKGDASEPSQGRTSSGIVHGGMIDRDAMARKLARARGKKISDAELDMIFDVFDTTGDGAIDTREYGKLVTDPAGSFGTQAGTVPGSTSKAKPR